MPRPGAVERGADREAWLAARLSVVTRPACETARLEAALEAGVDGPAFLRAVRRYRTAPLVDRALEDLPAQSGLSRDLRVSLWQEAEAWRRRSLRLAGEGEAILEALRGAGFRVLAIKGLDLARRLYPNPGLRPMADLDFLLTPEDLAPAAGLLRTRHGFEEPEGRAVRRHERFYRKRVLARRHPEGAVCADLHSVFYHPQLYPVDYGALWRRAEGAGGALSVEDALLHSCLIPAKDRYQSDLRDFVDIHQMCEGWCPDWPKVVERARQWKCSGPLFFSLSVAVEVLGTAVPPDVLESCRPGWVRRRWIGAFVSTRRVPAYRYGKGGFLAKAALRLPLADSPAGWVRFLAAHAAHALDPR